MGKSTKKPKPPTVDELQARIDALEGELQKESVARHEMRKSAEAHERRAELATAEAQQAKARQERAEEAARAAERARLGASKKAASERVEFERRLSVATSEALAGIGSGTGLLLAPALEPLPASSNGASVEAMAAEIKALSIEIEAEKRQSAAQLDAMAKLSQTKLEEQAKALAAQLSEAAAATAAAEKRAEAAEQRVIDAEESGFVRGKKRAEESAYRRNATC